MNMLCSSRFLSDEKKIYADYPSLLWCYVLCSDMLQELYRMVHEIDHIIDSGD